MAATVATAVSPDTFHWRMNSSGAARKNALNIFVKNENDMHFLVPDRTTYSFQTSCYRKPMAQIIIFFLSFSLVPRPRSPLFIISLHFYCVLFSIQLGFSPASPLSLLLIFANSGCRLIFASLFYFSFSLVSVRTVSSELQNEKKMYINYRLEFEL